MDEFDKMKSEHSSLLEAMEQQRVSVNKGGAERLYLRERPFGIAGHTKVGTTDQKAFEKT